jgi:hypothetical protein
MHGRTVFFQSYLKIEDGSSRRWKESGLGERKEGRFFLKKGTNRMSQTFRDCMFVTYDVAASTILLRY